MSKTYVDGKAKLFVLLKTLSYKVKDEKLNKIIDEAINLSHVICKSNEEIDYEYEKAYGEGYIDGYTDCNDGLEPEFTME